MKDWYLMTDNNRPHMLGGYENDSYNQYKSDSFLEAISTDFVGDTVTVYNYDLSESKVIRCVVQDNTANTMLNSMSRCVLCEVGTLKAGNYIFYEDRYWLVTGYPSNNNGYYEKAVMAICQYKIKWQDSNYKIHERWVNLQTASKYGTGEYNNNTLIVTENNMTMLTPYDLNTLDLDGIRFFLDTHKEKPFRVYRVNRNDDPLYDYGESHGAILSFVLDRVEYNKDTDNQELRICDYVEPDNESKRDETNIKAIFKGNRDLKIGSQRTYTVSFETKDGSPIEKLNYTFSFILDFGNSGLTNDDIKLSEDYNNYKAKLTCKKNIDLIGKYIYLCVDIDGTEVGKEKINIIDIV